MYVFSVQTLFLVSMHCVKYATTTASLCNTNARSNEHELLTHYLCTSHYHSIVCAFMKDHQSITFLYDTVAKFQCLFPIIGA